MKIPSMSMATIRAAVVGLVLLALYLAVLRCTAAGNEAKQSRLDASQARALSESAKDAIGAAGAVSASENAANDLTRSNQDEILSAAGADAPIDPALRDSGFASLCRRAAYRGHAECMQRAAAR